MKTETVYAFIDSQNLNLGTSNDVIRNNKKVYQGWKLDFRRFKKYLVNKYRVQKLFLFIGYLNGNEKLYEILRSCGYTLVFKPTTHDTHGKPKGNIDADLVLYAAAVEYAHFDTAVIVSGDGDFQCLLNFLESNKKLKALVIPNQYTESRLLKNFMSYKIFLNKERKKLEFRA